MHLNTHTGRNVHTCPYCSIQFISRQSYEGHIKSHTELEDDICGEEKGGLQIVSVKSIPTFEANSNSSLEEIQIEPDIIQEQPEEEKGMSLPNTANTIQCLCLKTPKTYISIFSYFERMSYSACNCSTYQTYAANQTFDSNADNR